MAKALIGFFWAWNVKTSMHEKSVSAPYRT